MEDLYVHFANFEEFCKETERARAIYRYALDHVPRSKVDELYARFVAFEKKQGSRTDIEDVLLSKKRLQVLPPVVPVQIEKKYEYSGLFSGSHFEISSRLREALATHLPPTHTVHGVSHWVCIEIWNFKVVAPNVLSLIHI